MRGPIAIYPQLRAALWAASPTTPNEPCRGDANRVDGVFDRPQARKLTFHGTHLSAKLSGRVIELIARSSILVRRIAVAAIAGRSRRVAVREARARRIKTAARIGFSDSWGASKRELRRARRGGRSTQCLRAAHPA
jgi:hypothetical protein